jgi:hypothetical protein
MKEDEVVKKSILKIISNKTNRNQKNWNQIWQIKKLKTELNIQLNKCLRIKLKKNWDLTKGEKKTK